MSQTITSGLVPTWQCASRSRQRARNRCSDRKRLIERGHASAPQRLHQPGVRRKESGNIAAKTNGTIKTQPRITPARAIPLPGCPVFLIRRNAEWPTTAPAREKRTARGKAMRPKRPTPRKNSDASARDASDNERLTIARLFILPALELTRPSLFVPDLITFSMCPNRIPWIQNPHPKAFLQGGFILSRPLGQLPSTRANTSSPNS